MRIMIVMSLMGFVVNINALRRALDAPPNVNCLSINAIKLFTLIKCSMNGYCG